MTIYNKIFEDNNIVVIDKLEEIPVLSKAGTKSLADLTSKEFPSTQELPDNGFTHRLDNKTKGILIIAKNLNTYEKIRKSFSKHDIEKTYLARVKGVLKQEEFSISYPIAHDKSKKKKMIAVKPGYRIFRSKPREAISNIKLIKTGENYSDIEIKTKYGLRHQIRVHLASIGFPIIGDNIYGKDLDTELMLIAKSIKIGIDNNKYNIFVSNLDLNTI